MLVVMMVDEEGERNTFLYPSILCQHTGISPSYIAADFSHRSRCLPRRSPPCLGLHPVAHLRHRCLSTMPSRRSQSLSWLSSTFSSVHLCSWCPCSLVFFTPYICWRRRTWCWLSRGYEQRTRLRHWSGSSDRSQVSIPPSSTLAL